MQIRTDPWNLNITDPNVTQCLRCNSALQKEIKLGKYLINGECGYCSYKDRPFACASSSWQQHFPGGCDCQYGEKEFLYITCDNCLNPKCKDCGIKLIKAYTHDDSDTCSICKNKEKKKEILTKVVNVMPSVIDLSGAEEFLKQQSGGLAQQLKLYQQNQQGLRTIVTPNFTLEIINS